MSALTLRELICLKKKKKQETTTVNPAPFSAVSPPLTESKVVDPHCAPSSSPSSENPKRQQKATKGNINSPPPLLPQAKPSPPGEACTPRSLEKPSSLAPPPTAPTPPPIFFQLQEPEKAAKGRKKPPIAEDIPKGKAAERGGGNIRLPKQKASTHPLAPVWRAYQKAYEDPALRGSKQRPSELVRRTMEAARAAGFEVENFDHDLYPMLRPWIMACGEPAGAVKWRPDLVALAHELLDYQPENEAAKELKSRAKAIGYPLTIEQVEELLFDMQVENR